MDAPNDTSPKVALRWYWEQMQKMWRTITEADSRFHNYLYSRWPRTMHIGGELSRRAYAAAISPAFAVILTLLLVGLVISGVVTIIVSVSVFSAWLIAVLSVARSSWVNSLRIGRKTVLVLVSAAIMAAGAHKYVKWVLISYAKNQPFQRATPEAGSAPSRDGLDQIAVDRFKSLFEDELEKLNPQPPTHKTKAVEKPDIGIKVFYSVGRGSISVALTNLAKDTVLYSPFFVSVIWDLDAPDMKQPLRLPSQSFKDDWIRPQASLGAYSITESETEKRVKKGDQLFGYIIAECPACKENKIYWVYAKFGDDGWYAETKSAPSFAKIEQQLDAIKNNTAAFIGSVPGEKFPITDYPF